MLAVTSAGYFPSITGLVLLGRLSILNDFQKELYCIFGVGFYVPSKVDRIFSSGWDRVRLLVAVATLSRGSVLLFVERALPKLARERLQVAGLDHIQRVLFWGFVHKWEWYETLAASKQCFFCSGISLLGAWLLDRLLPGVNAAYGEQIVELHAGAHHLLACLAVAVETGVHQVRKEIFVLSWSLS